MSCLCCWLRVYIHAYQVTRFDLFAFTLSLYSRSIKGIGGVVKCYKDIAVTNAHGGHVKGYLCQVMLFGTLFTSSAGQAENPANIARYTLQREKTSEFVSSAIQLQKTT